MSFDSSRVLYLVQYYLYTGTTLLRFFPPVFPALFDDLRTTREPSPAFQPGLEPPDPARQQLGVAAQSPIRFR